MPPYLLLIAFILTILFPPLGIPMVLMLLGLKIGGGS